MKRQGEEKDTGRKEEYRKGEANKIKRWLEEIK